MSAEHERLVRKLDSIAKLGDDERDALRGLPLAVRRLGADETVVTEGDRPSECCLVLDGLLCGFKMAAEGSRQITGFYIPGDLPDLQSLHLKVLDHSLAALTPSRLAFIPHQPLEALTRRYPALAAAFWRDTLIDGSIYREWVVNVGRRSGPARLAHIFCEMFARLKAVGLAGEDDYELPLTQAELGDAAGLSTVHVNRVLQELRGQGLIEFRGGAVRIPDWEKLKHAGEFDLTYLHQHPRPLP